MDEYPEGAGNVGDEVMLVLPETTTIGRKSNTPKQLRAPIMRCVDI